MAENHRRRPRRAQRQWRRQRAQAAQQALRPANQVRGRRHGERDNRGAVVRTGEWRMASSERIATRHSLFACSHRGDRMSPTATLPAIPLPPTIRSRFVEDINGLSMHVLEAGFESKGRPCVLLLHGFPELAFSWRKVMPQLAEA